MNRFAAMLPEKYRYINREPGGGPGLRQARENCRPSMFIKIQGYESLSVEKAF